MSQSGSGWNMKFIPGRESRRTERAQEGSRDPLAIRAGRAGAQDLRLYPPGLGTPERPGASLPCFRLELPSQLEPHTCREQASRELMGQEMGTVIAKDGTGMVTALPGGIRLQGQSGSGASL